MFSELIDSIAKWRIVHLMGISVLRARYARSYLGQLWLSVCALAQILVIGVVWSHLWRQTLDDFLPYYGVGFTIFTFVSGTICDSHSVLVGDARYYMNDKTPFMVSILAHIYRNFLIMLHNVPIVIGLLIYSHSARFAPGLSIVPAMAVTLCFIVFSSYVVAALCTRYRDLGQIVSLINQNLFILTPIMWQTSLLAPEIRDYIFINPLAAVIELLRNPVLGLPVSSAAWYSLGAWTALSVFFYVAVQRTLGKKLVFWI